VNAHGLLRAVLMLVAIAALAVRSFACPFCNAVTPTFAERRDSATAFVLGEAEQQTDGKWRFGVRHALEGAGVIAVGDTVEIKTDVPLQSGDLAILLAASDEDDAPRDAWRWSVMKVDPASYLYFSKTPSTRVPAAARLDYFLPFLDHENADVANDAFAEIGRAPLEAVESVSHGEIVPRLREWILDDALPDDRRGGYGLMLGLTKDPADRAKNAAVLREAIDRESVDFRAGFDGMLAGYLLLEPDSALKLIEERFIASPDARPGDTRHALAALRFCIEYARGPERDEVLKVMRQVLPREAFSAEVVTDLARWKDWKPLDEIVKLYDKPGDEDPQLRRAVIGYLKACPLPTAQTHLDRLRTADPEGVKALERRLSLPIDR
jgi:hypothetical protein